MKNKFGFTLTEILIALGIVGVISAITIPNLIKNYQKYKTVNQLKKVYTVLNQAFKMSELDNDSYSNWTRKPNDISQQDYVNKYWVPYLKVLKVCNNYQQCGYKSNTPWRNATNNNIAYAPFQQSNIILNDGTFLMFNRVYQDGSLFVDLNGVRKPNRYGKDLFTFYITSKGFIGTFIQANPNDFCKKNKTTTDNGFSCSGKIIKDGWKINNDYPW